MAELPLPDELWGTDLMKRHLASLVFATSVAFANLANGQLLFQENFDGLTLGPSVNERVGQANVTRVATDAGSSPRPNAFTKTGPAGWTIDNNFDNFGTVDLTNSGGTDVFSNDPVPVLLYRIPQPGFVVGNIGVANQGSAADGVDEWEGWSFANKNFWASVDDQQRSSFTNAIGTIAVADADEYDDLGAGLGDRYYNTGLTTASINVAPYGGQSVTLSFDSSWRAEGLDDTHADLGRPDNNQSAIVWASFDGGAPVFVDGSLWDSNGGNSNPGDNIQDYPASLVYKPDNVNERVSYNINIPAGAQNVKFTFGYFNAANDWWWALDNLALNQNADPAFWTEDFESVTLGSSVNERVQIGKVTAANNDPATTPRADSFTHTPPAGWSIDNSGIPAAAIGDNNIGVFEWEGWSFATKEFSVFSAQGALGNFTKSSGAFAVADSDEFDDFGGGSGITRPYNTILETPSIDVTGAAPGSLRLAFDSAWQDEGDQKAVITVDYGSGESEVLRWESVAGAFFHDDNLNESVLVDLNNPAGATSLKVRFKYLDAGNNWFWAIDNVQIGVGIPEPASLVMGLLAACAVVRFGRRSAPSA
jgi:hypothetical protein